MTILGGPLDGEVVDYCGRYLRLPIRRQAGYVGPEADDLPARECFRYHEFEVRQDIDGRWWYVKI